VFLPGVFLVLYTLLITELAGDTVPTAFTYKGHRKTKKEWNGGGLGPSESLCRKHLYSGLVITPVSKCFLYNGYMNNGFHNLLQFLKFSFRAHFLILSKCLAYLFNRRSAIDDTQNVRYLHAKC
jgi:hypothetical protein